MKKSACCVGTLAVCGLLLVGSFWAYGQQKESSGTKSKTSANDQTFTIRERTELVSLTVSVTDRNGRAIEGLTPDDIEVYEDKIRQKIELYSMDDAPVSVGVIFDLSGSMQQKLDAARQSLKSFVENSHIEDDFFLLGFNQRARLLAESCDSENLASRLNMINAQGNTALYDAVYLGAEKIMLGRHRRRALLIISDGQDNASRYSVSQLRQQLKEIDVQLYCIGIGRAGTLGKGEQREQQRGHMILDDLAKMTGGKAFFITAASELENAMSRIALELRQQYSLAYAPTNQKRDGRWRKIQVRVNRPDSVQSIIVRAREGYFAPPF